MDNWRRAQGQTRLKKGGLALLLLVGPEYALPADRSGCSSVSHQLADPCLLPGMQQQEISLSYSQGAVASLASTPPCDPSLGLLAAQTK